MQDPYGITFWPNFKGRDGCRTPMPWHLDDNCPQAGFSAVTSWLPVGEEHRKHAVSLQDKNQDSILNAFRHFMAWRKTQPVLLEGDIGFINTAEPILAFYRKYDGKKMLCIFNLAQDVAKLELNHSNIQPHTELIHHNGSLHNNTLTLPGFGCFYADVN